MLNILTAELHHSKTNNWKKELLYAIRGRHPNMAFRKTMSLGHERVAVTWERGLRVWTRFWRKFNDEHVSLLTDPRRILV